MKAVLALPILLMTVAACGMADDAPKAEAAQAIPVEVARAAPTSGADAVTGTGTIAREREQVLSFRWPGAVRALNVDAGDAVARGQTLAILDATAVEARLRQAQADFDKAQRDVARDAELARNGWISPQRLADRQTGLSQARAAVDAARFDMQWSRLVAPSSGVVLVRHIEAGEVVGAGQPVLTIADAGSPMVARVPLADSAVARVRLGQAARVRIDALGGEAVTGVVSRVGARADARTGTVDVEVRLPPGLALKTGYLANAEIFVTAGQTAAADRMRVPAEAILEAEGAKAFVFIATPDGKTAKRLSVAFHGFDGDDALVSGLDAGVRVITRGGAYVRDGGQIIVAEHGAD